MGVIKQFDVPMNTLRQLLVRPKDKILKELVVGQVYHIPYGSCEHDIWSIVMKHSSNTSKGTWMKLK